MELPNNFYDELYIGLNYYCRHYRDGKPIESDEYEDEYDDCIQFCDEYCADVSIVFELLVVLKNHKTFFPSTNTSVRN